MSDILESDEWVGAYAPATIANVGPGFDCFGFSLGEPGDKVYAKLTEGRGVRIAEMRGHCEGISNITENNTAGRAAVDLWNRYPAIIDQCGLELVIDKGIRPGTGIGSSASSAAAAAAAVMFLIEKETGAEYSAANVLEAAVTGESVASGSRHADNVAPSLFGGFTLVQSTNPLYIAHFEPLLDLYVAAVLPDIYISTKESRQALPKEIKLRKAAKHWANASALVAAMLTGDEDLFASSFKDDLVEPERAKLITGFDEAKAAALDTGALGFSIGGSGPTVYAVTNDKEIAQKAGEAITTVFDSHDLKSESFIRPFNNSGVKKI